MEVAVAAFVIAAEEEDGLVRGGHIVEEIVDAGEFAGAMAKFAAQHGRCVARRHGVEFLDASCVPENTSKIEAWWL
jgi:hypothetical protein